MDLEKVELHDATLKSMSVDYAAKSVTISVDFYKGKDDHEKAAAVIIFDEVESFSQVSNFEALHKWRTTGNIVQWVPATGKGTTYIDVIGGSIAINAKKVRFKPEK